MDTVAFVTAMLGVGAGVGVVSAALGIGGGLLMVPVFLTVFAGDMDINTAKGTSLLVIVFVALFNSWRMNRAAMKSPWSLVLALAAGSVAGGFLGGYLTSRMPDVWVTWIFIGLIAFAGIRSFFLRPRIVEERDVTARQTLAAVIGLASGVVAGATGTGGGAILVPLALWAGIVSNERVVALSNTVMVATALSGGIAHALGDRTSDVAWTVGMVSLTPVPLVVIGALAAAGAGRWVNSRLTLPRRRVVMGVLLLAIAARLVMRTLA